MILRRATNNALVAFVALVRRGKMSICYPTVLAKYAISQIIDGRRVGNSLCCNEVLSPYAQRLKNFKVERLDHRDKEDNARCEILIEDKTAGPAQTACSRIDFDQSIRSLPCRHRRIAQYLSLGNRTADAARKFKVTAGRISQVRKELAKSWSEFIGDNEKISVA